MFSEEHQEQWKCTSLILHIMYKGCIANTYIGTGKLCNHNIKIQLEETIFAIVVLIMSKFSKCYSSFVNFSSFVTIRIDTLYI